MGRAPRSQRRRFGLGEVLVPPQAQPVQPLVECLESLRSTWRREGSLAALWQDWPQLAGRPLADHCKPLNLSHGVLTVGARHPQWRQALQYSKPQLLAAVRSAGHAVRDLRIQQHHPSPTAALDTEEIDTMLFNELLNMLNGDLAITRYIAQNVKRSGVEIWRK